MVYSFHLFLGAILLMPLLFASLAIAAPVDIDADEISRSADGVVVARGHVVIKREWDTLMADEVIYRTEQHVLEAKGHVVIKSEKSTIETDKAIMQTQSKTGYMNHAVITLLGGERLIAERVKRIDDQTYEAEKVIFSSCPIDEESWRVAASHAVIDQQEGTLTADHARFELWQIPVFYTPWWQQALKRKSGLLMPTLASGKLRGTEVSLPLYFAPQKDWDVTLTPHWMSARGVMGKAEIRHASTLGYEELNYAGINDDVTNRSRSRLNGKLLWQLPADMQLNATADHVSDRFFLADYNTSDQVSSPYTQSIATLSQGFNGGAFEGSWSLQTGHLQNLLLQSNATTLQILSRLQSNSQWQLSPNTVVHLDQQSTRYSRRSGGVDGWRVNLHPYIEMPWRLPDGGVSALLTLGAQHTRYWLQKSALANSNPTRTTQEASLEVRLDLERIGGERSWRHVVSPIIRYDYIDAPNQSLLPNFDSGFGLFTWGNLLSGNYFSGFDRIEKTNRFSVMLENRLQVKGQGTTGARDVLILRAGLSYDLLRQSIDPALQVAPVRPFSNLLGEVVWQPIENMHIYATGQYDQANRYWANYNASASFAASGNSLLFAYQVTDKRYSTKAQLLSANAKLDLGSRWKVTGFLQYDMVLKYTQQSLVGLQYEHPCWTVGLEAYKNTAPGITGAVSNLGYRLLLEFKGLGSVGS